MRLTEIQVTAVVCVRIRMEQITIRIQEEFLESIESGASEHNESRSEHIRDLLRKGMECGDVRRDHDRLENQLAQVIEQRDEHQELVQYVNEEQSWRSAPIWKRGKWWLLGRKG
jgi:metal-responsive CopG/Arc/MetJ family transcriptional regulator